MARNLLAFLLGVGSVVLVGVGLLFGTQLGQPKQIEAGPKAEAKPAEPSRIGHVVTSELMSGYKKWQELAKAMNDKRAKSTKQLEVQRNALIGLQQRAQAAGAEEKDKLTAEARNLQRKLEDDEQKLKKEIDTESAKAIEMLYTEISAEIEKLAKERKLDVVYGIPAHPERTLEDLKIKNQNTATFYDLMLRVQGAQPLYLRDAVDVTETILERLNAAYEAERK